MWRALKAHQPRFLGMELQTILSEPLVQYGEHPASIFLVLEEEDRVIRVADEHPLSSKTRFDDLLEPLVEDLVQVPNSGRS
jgi:hypothetical protein